MMLSLQQITRTYGATVANNRVSLEIERGEIVGLVGENGAGKSTLLAILGGFVQPDSGRIMLDGEPVVFGSPAAARMAGIGLVHQHRTLVPTFTVREQLRLAGWTGPDLPEVLGTGISSGSRIEQLSPGEQQRVEIARELVSSPRILLLDEPTSVLAPSEVETLFAAIRRIRAGGTSVVIVSHKLHEVLGIADRVVVLARGQVTGEFARLEPGWGPDAAASILAAMFPDQTRASNPEPGPVAGAALDTVLVARGLTAIPLDGGPPLREIDLDLAGGRIHVVVGVDGQGQGLLAQVIAGYQPARGELTLDGESIGDLAALDRARRGISLMAGDRTTVAAIPAFSVSENLALKRPRAADIAGRLTLRRKAIDREASLAVAAWDVRPPEPGARFGTLSGGNMQRVIAARDIPRGTRLLIAVNPVQGLDVRTSEVLWRRLRQHAATGAAVLVFVSDLDEAMANADALAVMFNGTLSVMAPVATWSRPMVATRMVGG